MATRKQKAAGFSALALVVFVAFANTYRPSPLAKPPALIGDLPKASPPAQMRIFRLPTGVTHRNAAFAYRGGSFTDKRDFAMTAVLVEHPRGNLLIDTGLGRDIDAQFARLPFWFRATTSYTRSSSAKDQLGDETISAILLTHAHWDHASGLPDFGDVPVMVTPEEHRFVESGDWITRTAREAKNAHWSEYAFDDGPYLGFPKSHDVYADGSIVVVPAPGHTPGSVIVFLNEPNGKRWALVGDLVWQEEGITEREERPWLQRTLADRDASAVRENILRMYAIHARFPEITLVPAHDSRGFADMLAFER